MRTVGPVPLAVVLLTTVVITGCDASDSDEQACAEYQEEAREALDALDDAMNDPTAPNREFEATLDRATALQDVSADLEARGIDCRIER